MRVDLSVPEVAIVALIVLAITIAISCCGSAGRANVIRIKMRTRCDLSEGEKSTKVSEDWARRVTYKEMLVTIALV